MLPRLHGAFIYYRATKHRLDQAAPRSYQKQLVEDPALDPKTRAKILRCEGAMMNGHENIVLFAAAIVAGNAAGLDNELLNGLSLGYIASRLLYNIVYAWQDSSKKALLRPLTFFLGLGICFALFVMAGNEFQNGATLR